MIIICKDVKVYKYEHHHHYGQNRKIKNHHRRVSSLDNQSSSIKMEENSVERHVPKKNKIEVVTKKVKRKEEKEQGMVESKKKIQLIDQLLRKEKGSLSAQIKQRCQKSGLTKTKTTELNSNFHPNSLNTTLDFTKKV